MLNRFFRGLFDSSSASVIAPGDFLLCVGCALAVGLILAGCYLYRTRYTKGFVATLALLPALVCVVIMMVNGNVGAGVAVAGAFSLVRFRSAPGSAKEIAAIFLAMGTGNDPKRWEEYLVLAMGRCTGCFEKLPLVQDKAILDNILYSGVWIELHRQQRKDQRKEEQ